MQLSITTTYQPATDLGYLLHKHPQRRQSFTLSWGQAEVFYSAATAQRCTAVLSVEIDPVALRQRRQNSFVLDNYVSDRPYVASSLLSVALARIYTSALAGKCKERPDLVSQALPLEIHLPALPCRQGERFLRELFEPLGYSLALKQHPLDEHFTSWGQSPYFAVTLSHTAPLSLVLTHLYVLIPVLDDDKHYYIGDGEVDKLLSRGQGWLPDHPQRDLIAAGYLKHQRNLKQDYLARLEEPPSAPSGGNESELEKGMSLQQIRLKAVQTELERCGARRVLDLGCGEGRLLEQLLPLPQFDQLAGMDVSHRALQRGARRLRLEQLTGDQSQRLVLFQGSLLYRDARLAGWDAAALVEVIEHLDEERLPTFERVVFEFARPTTVLITTPNAEYNRTWDQLPAGHARHEDHRFEWSRDQFHTWAAKIAARFAYKVRFTAIGPEAESVGSPTQMGIFTLDES